MILRYAAFASTPDGGNPAGVVLDASALDEAAMLRIAAEVGYSETAFVTVPPSAAPGPGSPATVGIRYYSPAAEVPFCGHATIATAVALAERLGTGEFVFATPAGEVRIDTSATSDGVTASFTSVPPLSRKLEPAVLAELLDALGLRADDLRSDHPALEVFAGNWHPILVLADRTVFHQFRFHPPTVAALMVRQGWTGTITVLSVLGAGEYEARNPFVVGRITEDPATGSAAASTGAYLRTIGAVTAPADIVVRQGAHVGRPSLLRVHIPLDGGCTVTGTAVPIG